MWLIQKEVQNIYIGEVKEYSIDFRWNTQSNIEADGWTFTARNSWTWSFSSSWLSETRVGGQVFVNRIIDFTKYTKIKLEWSCYLADKWWSWDGWCILNIVPNGQDFFESAYRIGSFANRNVGTSAINRWYRLFYNNTDYSTGSTLSAWNYTWDLNINLSTGDISWSMSNWLSLNWTLTSTYLNAIKTSTTKIGAVIDSNSHILYTFNVILS